MRMICHLCGIEAPTRYVSFHQNIGAFYVRFYKGVEGKLCKSCIHKHFWSLTATTFFFGWWGAISFIVTPYFILHNLGRYLLCLGMKPVPPGATRPTLTAEAIERLTPHTQQIFDRLNQGEKFQDVARDVAALSETTPAQIALFVDAVIQANPQRA